MGLLSIITVMILFVIIGVLISKSLATLTVKQVRKPRVNWVMTGYAVILLLSAIIYLVLPDDKLVHGTYNANNGKILIDNNRDDLINTALRGGVDKFDDSFIKNQWEFILTGDELNISASSADNVFILAERIESNEQKIKLTYYASKTIIDNYDLTDQIKPPIVEWDNNTLTIMSPPTTKVNLVKFPGAFPMTQFLDGGPGGRGHVAIFGSHLLYIRIPAGVKVNGHIDFVG